MGPYLIQVVTRGFLPWLILISLAGWGLLLGSVQMLSIPAFCGAFVPLAYAASWQGIEQVLLFNPPRQLVVSWLLMLLAMTPLLLVHPLTYVWQRSLLRKRWQAVVLFVLGFASVWTLAGLLLMTSVIAARVMFGVSQAMAFVVTLAVCLVWQASPLKQRYLNRCHHQPRISAFGWGFIRDCLAYGVTSGGWCIGSCWALMLLPMLAEQVHLPMMLLAMGWMLLERLQRTQPARWRWPFQLRLFH
ncbi:hypothetical protein BLL42_24370 [Pseudomonas frederiksbergensis]|uniref:DUF2182 domain-containing protein n=1 Tax=Pseudomonas frederiksbergensis TaxID=104087 RepID=A0A1J0ERV2_9PSED|nr:DUF2182 domain-containing protein [Pseudomonas frederiksbergensis]APC18691.1 hypothetical protein BLL42_24370 [Pseudomonas frederiksbergensis]